MEISKFPLKVLGMLAGLFAFAGANTQCMWFVHDPDKPKELKKLQKI